MKNKRVAGIISLIVILGLFVLAAYIAQSNIEKFAEYAGNGIYGSIFYVLILVAAAVFAPISVLPLVPIASSQWGWFMAGVLTLVGESIGAMIAFLIARNYGYPLVRKLVSLDNIHKIEKFVPEKHIFAGIIVLRVAVPFDIVSYALGILSKVRWKTYIFASIVGLIPYAFVTAYLGGLPYLYMINIILIGLILFLVIIILGLRSRTDFRKFFSKWWEKKFKRQPVRNI